MEKVTNDSLIYGFSTKYELSILLSHRAKMISLGALSPLPHRLSAIRKPAVLAMLELRYGYSTYDSLLKSFIESSNDSLPQVEHSKIQQKALIDDRNYDDFTIENDIDD